MSAGPTTSSSSVAGGEGEASPILADLLASLVVFLVALPLCIGIAVACGVPAEKGIITGIVGGLLVGAIAGSPLLVSGPAASLIVLVNQLVADHGIAALAPVVVLAGLWQIVAGSFGLGQWFRAVAPAVITGMLIGIGVLIFGSQLHVAIDGDPKSAFLDNMIALVPAVATRVSSGDVSQIAPMLLGIATIAIIVVWEKLRPKKLGLVPGHLVSLVMVTSCAALLALPIRYLDIAPNFFGSIELVGVADLGILLNPSVVGLSLVFAFVASAATLLTAAAIDQRQTHARTDYNREMVAQGVGNALAGAIGGLPMTGVIVRSSVNVDAGARTRLSAILHGLWLVLFVAVAPQVLELIPRASLGAILVYTGYKLINVQQLRELDARGRSELVIALVTCLTVVFVDLFVGIVLGLGAAIAKLLYTFTHLEVRSESAESGEAHHLHLAGSATFLRLPMIAEALEAIPAGRVLHVHIDRLEYIDHACLELLSVARKQRSVGSAPGMLLEWDELTERHDPAFRLGRGPTSGTGRSASLLSVLWREWRRLYASRRPDPDPDDPPASDPTPPSDWLAADRIRLGLDASSLSDVLDAAADLLAPAAGLEREALVESLHASNEEGCVIIAEGTGLPHAALPDVAQVLGAVVTTGEPLTIDGEDVDLFFVLLAPRERPRRHLVALAHVGRLCHDHVGLAALRAAASPDEAMTTLLAMEKGIAARPSRDEREARVLLVIDVDENQEAEGALLALLEESHPGRARAQALDYLGPVVEVAPDHRVITVVLEASQVEPFRRLVSESALVLGCRVTLHVVRGE